MSHIATVKTKIMDLEALKAACRELGAEFKQGQKTYAWYGERIGNDPLPEGMRIEDLGKCDHAIHVPGVRYEIGIVKVGNHFKLAYDFYGYDGCSDRHDGHKLQEKFGVECGKLVQSYAVHVAMRQAAMRGLSVHRTTLTNGSVKLMIGGV